MSEKINLFPGVVESEGGPDRSLHPKPLENRLGAVMPGPYRHPLLVQDGAGIVRMDAIDNEGEYACFRRGLADDLNAINRRRGRSRVIQKVLFVSLDRLKSGLLDILYRCAQTNGAGNVRGPCFKLVGDPIYSVLSKVTERIISPPP